MWPGDVASYYEYHEDHFRNLNDPPSHAKMPLANKSTMTGFPVNGDVPSSRSLYVGKPGISESHIESTSDMPASTWALYPLFRRGSTLSNPILWEEH